MASCHLGTIHCIVVTDSIHSIRQSLYYCFCVNIWLEEMMIVNIGNVVRMMYDDSTLPHCKLYHIISH